MMEFLVTTPQQHNNNDPNLNAQHSEIHKQLQKMVKLKNVYKSCIKLESEPLHNMVKLTNWWLHRWKMFIKLASNRIEPFYRPLVFRPQCSHGSLSHLEEIALHGEIAKYSFGQHGEITKFSCTEHHKIHFSQFKPTKFITFRIVKLVITIILDNRNSFH